MKQELTVRSILNLQEYLTFDDLLLVPQYSEIVPKDVDVKTKIGDIELKLPIISSAMDTVTESKMAIALANIGALGIIHRNMSIDLQVKEVEKVKTHSLNNIVGAAVGATGEYFERAQKLVAVGINVLAIDTAHGHSKNVLEAVRKIKDDLNVTVIAGNVATGDGAIALYEAGADGIKVGIGPGSICTTRVISGVGVPQIHAIAEVLDAVKNKNIAVIADGGIRYSGDIAKAMALGVNAVMLGSLLASCDESPGETVVVNEKKYKVYRGMGSIGAMSKGSSDRYFQENNGEDKFVPEGISGMVPFKGYVSEVVYQLVGGLRSGMGYTGSKNLEELKDKAKFIKVSTNSLAENHPHDIFEVEKAPNY